MAVFDNDGTLWCEKPMPIQLDFILRRFAEMADADQALVARQPWKATSERDYAWFGALMDEHYAGDDTNVQAAGGGDPGRVRRDQRRRLRGGAPRSCAPPSIRRSVAPYLECAYAPMVELLDYLEANGFTNYIASGGGRDFMRPISQDDVRHPPRAGDRQQQHVRVHQRRARRDDHPQAGGRLPRRRPGEAGADLEPHRPPPAARGGNSNGDVPMLEFTAHADRPTLRLLVLHDDAEREFAYTAGAEQALEPAADRRLDRGQHQERLDHGVLIGPIRNLNAAGTPVRAEPLRARHTDADGRAAPDKAR